MKKALRILALIVFVGLVGYVVKYLYSQSKKDPVIYETQVAERATIINKTVATGAVVPRREIEIKPQESGIITEIFVEEGDMVKTGDVLAKLRIIPEMVQVNNAEAQFRRAKIAAQNAEIEFQRSQKLYDEQVIPESEYLSEKLRYETSIADRDAAENNLQLIKEGVTKNMKGQTNTIIKSTIDGMVLDVPIKEGTMVTKSNTFNPGTTIANVADMTEMIFEGQVDETEVGKIKEGMELMLSIGAIDAEKFSAKLEFIAPKGVEENGAIQFEIKAGVTLKDDQFIRAGYSATADIVLDRRDSVLAVKEQLINFRNDSAFVEVETSPQIFEERVIKTGLSDGITIEVLDGITEEDKVKVPKG